MSSNKMYDARFSPNSNDNPASTPKDPSDPGAQSTSNDYWLLVARDAYTQAQSYFDANIRSDLERNYSHFGNRHAGGSKYYKASYKHRHKGFRPKTRSIVRKNEAACAVAMFSTVDALHIEAARSTKKSHQISAEINQELLQYRLDNTIPWYLTSLGAYQETMVSNVVISHQYWNYREVKNRIPQTDETGELMVDEDDMPVYAEEYLVVKDTPACELRPIENVLFSPAADWADPINSSPYLIDKISMTIDDIIAMADPSSGTKIPWFPMTEEKLLVGVTGDYDAVRKAREAQRQDSKDLRYLNRGFDSCWVHRNIIRDGGRDYIFYTLGIHFRLSDPVPLEVEYPELKVGQRPYVLGVSSIEAHKNYPEPIVGLVANTQQEANEINNQRRDNVALVLNRRWIVRRSASIDYSSLQRNVPGGVTETDDITSDIRSDAPPEITGSSYKEQDMVNMDFDELAGNFSSSSVATNRKLGETVGGMELMAGESDSLTEYPLRTFVITWVIPVLKQLIRLEQTHESDEALLQLMGEKLNLWQRFKINRVTDAWIQGSMNIQVNVGFGSTNPKQRVDRLAVGLNTMATFAPQMQTRLDEEEVASEIFGALGYAGSERFYPKDKQLPPGGGPQEGQLTEQNEADLNQKYQMHLDILEDKNLERIAKAELKAMDREIQQQKLLESKTISEDQYNLNMAKIQTERQTQVDKMKVILEEMKIKRALGSGI